MVLRSTVDCFMRMARGISKQLGKENAVNSTDAFSAVPGRVLKCKVTAAVPLSYRSNLEKHDKNSRVSRDHRVVSKSLSSNLLLWTGCNRKTTYPAVAANISNGLASVPQVRIAKNKTKKPVIVPSL